MQQCSDPTCSVCGTDVTNFNDNHDDAGRFASGDGGGSGGGSGTGGRPGGPDTRLGNELKGTTFEKDFSIEGSPDATVGEKYAAFSYVGASYQLINGYLRKDGATDTEDEDGTKASEYVACLDSLMGSVDASKFNSNEMLYRGTNGIRFEDVKVGDTITDSGFASTSASLKIANGFASGHRIGAIVHISGVQQGFVVSRLRKGESSIGGESEVILPRGSRFVVESVVGLSTKYRINVRWQPPAQQHAQHTLVMNATKKGTAQDRFTDWTTDTITITKAKKPKDTPTMQRSHVQLAIQQVSASRDEELMGHHYRVFPAVLVREQVLHNNLGATFLPFDEIEASTQAWNMVPVVLRHPVLRGRPVSARDPDVLNSTGIGFLFRARAANGKLMADVFLDKARLESLPDALLSVNAMDGGTAGEISTGFSTTVENTAGEHKGTPYTCILREVKPDHLAVLPDEIGACSVKDGCGLGVLNAAGEQVVLNCEGGCPCKKADGGVVVILDDVEATNYNDSHDDKGLFSSDGGGGGGGSGGSGVPRGAAARAFIDKLKSSPEYMPKSGEKGRDLLGTVFPHGGKAGVKARAESLRRANKVATDKTREANRLSAKANKTGASRRDNLKAADAHDAARTAHETAGNTGQALIHFNASMDHQTNAERMSSPRSRNSSTQAEGGAMNVLAGAVEKIVAAVLAPFYALAPADDALEPTEIANAEQSDEDRRTELSTELTEAFGGPGIMIWIESMYSDVQQVVFQLSTSAPGGASGLYRSTWTVEDDGGLSFSTPEPVTKVTVFEPAANGAAGQFTQEERTMNRKEQIAHLVRTGPLDEPALNKLSDCQLTALVGVPPVAAVTTAPAAAAVNTNGLPEIPVAAPNATADVVAALSIAHKYRERLETLDSLTINARNSEERERAKLMDDVLYARNRAWSDEDVRGMSLDTLRKVHTTLCGRSSDFSGRGGPRPAVNSLGFEVRPIMGGNAGESVLDTPIAGARH